MCSRSYLALRPYAPMQGIRLGRPGCQTVKQILRCIPGFMANAGICALHAILDRIVHCGIDAGCATRAGTSFRPPLQSGKGFT
jgi:hypothetical protein